MIHIDSGQKGDGIFNLLLITEREENRKVLDEAVGRSAEHRVVLAASEPQALRILEKQNIGLAILDLLSPGLDGVGLYRDIQRKGRPAEVLLIVAPSGLGELQSLLQQGTGDFILDPISPVELELRIHAARTRAYGGSAIDSLFQEIQRLRRLCEELRESNDELRRLSDLDPLTALANRRGLFYRLDVEVDRAVRQRLPLSGIMMDIDNFKWINDNFGHQCGDMVLREVGQRLARNQRKYDYAARYGGEEFFILLPSTRSSTAMRIADRFRNDLEKKLFSCGGRQFRITISLGVAELQEGETREQWVARADEAMYEAKRLGRNRAQLAASR